MILANFMEEQYEDKDKSTKKKSHFLPIKVKQTLSDCHEEQLMICQVSAHLYIYQSFDVHL